MNRVSARIAGTVSGATVAMTAAWAHAAAGGEGGGSIIIWGFIGFCTLILIGQLIPALVNFLSARKVLEQQVQDELAEKGKLEQVQAVFDRE